MDNSDNSWQFSPQRALLHPAFETFSSSIFIWAVNQKERYVPGTFHNTNTHVLEVILASVHQVFLSYI